MWLTEVEVGSHLEGHDGRCINSWSESGAREAALPLSLVNSNEPPLCQQAQERNQIRLKYGRLDVILGEQPSGDLLLAEARAEQIPYLGS
jgi:hypothetical protein